jgi:hypothetical protein
MLSNHAASSGVFSAAVATNREDNRSQNQAGQSSTSTGGGKLAGLTTMDRLSMSSLPPAPGEEIEL